MKTFSNIKNDTDGKNILRILSDIHDGIYLSQRKISHKLGISAGLTNSYVKRCVKKGWIKIKSVPRKRYIYYLTPKGFIEKSKLTAEYLKSSFSLYRDMREECQKILKKCKKKNLKKILLYFSSELSEVFILTAREIKINFSGIVIPLSKQDKFFGIKILSNLPKNSKEIDSIILCDIKNSYSSYLLLKKKYPESKIITPKILRIRKK